MLNRLALLLCLVLLASACNFAAPPAKKAAPVEPPPAADPAIQANQEIKNDFTDFAGTAGVYAKNLNTGATFSFNQDTVFPTASTHKLVVALATYKYLYPNASQAKRKLYDENIKKMITVSDNPAFYEMLDEIEKTQPDALTKVLADLNLVRTRIHSKEAFATYGYHSVTTPYEMAVVLEAIQNEQYLGPDRSNFLKENLAKTIFKEEIPRFMQAKVMHKTGELPGVLTDVGIIDDGKNQILISAYTTPRQESEQASTFIAQTSAKIYNLLRDKNGEAPK